MSTEHLPDLGSGLPLSAVPDRGLLTGRLANETVIVWRTGNAVHAFGAS